MKTMPLLAVLLTAAPAMSQVSEAIKADCMKAVDFAGCVKTLQGNPTPAKRSFDFLGEPVIDGWIAYEDMPSQSIVYINPSDVRKVKVRSLFGRYFEFQYFKRQFVPAVAAVPGTPGRWVIKTPERQQCVYSNNQRTCKTIKAVKEWQPGKPRQPAQPEHVSQISSDALVDCLEGTAKWSNMQRRWRKKTAFFIQNAITDFCHQVDALEPSTSLKLASGSPTSADIRFVRRQKP